jgi:catechol 2,3-dioxygenase-like lactoylglutathione lyase family enzyme
MTMTTGAETNVAQMTRGFTRSPLVGGFNHVAQVTRDLDRLARFYDEVLEVPFCELPGGDDRGRHGFLLLGRGTSEEDPGPVLHVFEVPEEVTGPLPDAGAFFRRGRLDHLAIEASDERSLCEIRDRLVERGASDGSIRLFGGWFLSVHLVDPDGMELEVGCRWTGEVVAREDLDVEH